MSITIHFIAPHAGSMRAEGHFSSKNGQSLMQAATHANIEAIAADCGGTLTCATCHVYVDEAWAGKLPAPSRDELAMLEMTASERKATSRLSCQIIMRPELDGLRIELPPTQY
jgi:ferredoxin, 2Fe-2S